MMRKLPVSVCLVSGAEAQRIGRALKSVADWTSEIVVVLNQEVTDGTAEIAAQFGARVIRHPWQGFRDQKNLALTYAQQPWVLALDADEEVSPALREEIARFFHGQHQHAVGASFPRKVWFLGRWITHGDWYPDRVLRLFRRDQGKWGGSSEHCHIELDGAACKLRGDLHHYTNPTIASYVQKMPYYADLFLERQLAARVVWSAPAAVVRAVWRFFRAYFFRLGFLDGYPGFFIAASTAYATLVRHSRLFEHQQQQRMAPPCHPPESP
jgi:glycosyltransferase involved in cell wall biosynthesis